MKNCRGKQRVAFGIATVSLGVLPALASAGTIMINDGFSGSGQSLPANYGDRVNASSVNFTASGGGTPNIVMDYQVLEDHPSNDPGAGTFLTNTNWPVSEGGVIQLSNGSRNRFLFIFTPDPGYAVQIDSWDIIEAPGGGNTYVGWAIHQTGNTIDTYASGDLEDLSDVEDFDDIGGRRNIAPLVIGAPGESLTLSIFHGGGDPSSLAIDNIAFSQVPVPEPAMLTLAGMGTMMVLSRRRW